MANRVGTILSDENMRKVCFEGKPVPINRFDLMLPPPKRSTDIYYKDPGTIQRMERPSTVASKISNLSGLSNMPQNVLYDSYAKTLQQKRDIDYKDIDIRRYLGSGRLQTYTPDITDEIYNTLMNAQLYTEDVGILASLEELETAEMMELPQSQFTQTYPPVGREELYGFAKPGRKKEMSETSIRQAEIERRQQEFATPAEIKPVSETAVFKGKRGGVRQTQLDEPPSSGIIGMGGFAFQ